MGAFIDNYERPDVYIPKHGVRQNCGRVNPWAALGIQFGQYTIGGILSGDIKLGGDGKGGSEGKVDKETQKQIDDKKKELTAVYNQAGASSAETFNNALTTQESKVKTIQGELNQIGTVEFIQDQITNLQAQLDTAKKNNDQNTIDSCSYQIGELNTRLEKAQQKEKELKQAQVELARLQGLQGQAQNIEHEILKLQDKELPDNIDYDVTKETDDLKNFNAALKEFKGKTKPTPADAAALIAAFESGDNGVQNKTARNAFDIVKQQYPELFNLAGAARSI